MTTTRHPSWTTVTLASAGMISLAWSLVLMTAPRLAFRLAALPLPNYPQLVQIIGMAVGLMGLGLVIASTDPQRHWPIVLLGLIAKTAATVGITSWTLAGRLPADSLWIVLFSEAVWLVPLALILRLTYSAGRNVRRTLAPELVRMSLRARTQHDVTLDELTRLSPVLIVFLRHTGCTFCREALSDLASKRAEIEKTGTRLVLVHMGTDAHAAKFFERYGLQDVPRVSDPNKALFRAFGLRRGTLSELFGPKVWWRGFQAGILARHGVGPMVGDGFQMPGAFLLFHGEILRSYRHQSAADRPNYMALVTGQEFVRPEVRS